MLTIDNTKIQLVLDKFPAGEALVKVIGDFNAYNDSEININFNYEHDGEFIQLMMIVDAIRRLTEKPINLHMPYLPYARQDRVCNTGESFSIKVIANLINSMKFNRVVCKDLHSDVSNALIDNLLHLDLSWCASKLPFIQNSLTTVLVSPDAGANKKVFNYAKAVGYNRVVRADKTRDVSSGQITGTVVYSDHIGTDDFLVIDDICDGGRTFIELGKELRKLTDGNVYLYVTHGIFSKGIEPLEPYYDEIYVCNMMNKSIKSKLIYEV